MLLLPCLPGLASLAGLSNCSVKNASSEHSNFTLERLGYEVVARTNSIEALQAFQAQPHQFDLVITDETMPNMIGEELAKQIMHIRPDVPVHRI